MKNSTADIKVREKGGEEALQAEISLHSMERTHTASEKQCEAKKD